MHIKREKTKSKLQNKFLARQIQLSTQQQQILGKQLRILAQQQRQANDNYFTHAKVDSVDFVYGYLSLMKESMPPNYFNYDSTEQLKFVNNLDSTVKKEMINPYPLLNDFLYPIWKNIHDEIGS